MIIEEVDKDDFSEKHKRSILDFLSTTDMNKRITSLIVTNDPGKIGVDLDLLRERHPTLCEDCIDHPIEMMKLFEEIILEENQSRFGVEGEAALTHRLRVSFEGNLGRHTITPRGLRARFVRRLIKMQGIVISSSGSSD